MDGTRYPDIDFETFFSVNLDLLCIADLEGHFIKINRSWAETLGYDIDYLEGKKFLDFIHPDDLQPTLDTMNDLSEQKSVFNFVNRYRHKDGSYKYIEWRSTPKDGLIYAAARDITARIQAEKEIRRLSNAVEFNTAVIVIAQKDGEITYVNDKFSELTGYSRNEVLGQNPRILKSGDQDENFYKNLWVAISSGKPWKGEFHNRKKDGTLYWEKALISPIMNNSGEVEEYVAVKEDITEQKAASEALQESRELLDLFFRQSLDGFFFMMLDEPVEWNGNSDKDAILDYAFTHQRITKINKAMLDQYRAQECDFIGLTPADFFEHDPDHGKKVWRDFFDSGKLHIDTREARFDGTSMIVEGDYICLYDKEGRITGHFGVQRDVTFEREALQKVEESEQKFRQLAENIDQVFFLRTEKEILYVSPAYEKIWGRSVESLFDDPDSAFVPIHPEDREWVVSEFMTGMGDFKGEYRIVRPDGEVRWISTRMTGVRGGGGDSRRYAGIADDITDRKVLEEKLREASVRDPLTGLYNRRYLYERLEPLYEKAKRDGRFFSVSIIDIDHFKKINDTFGHAAGDCVLKRFAELLDSSVRPYDIVGRYGGEEFLVVMIDVEQRAAVKLIERILEKTRELVIDYEGKEVGFTFSAGVADSWNCCDPGCTTESIITEADHNLYKAKEAGRNRIV